MRRPAALFLGIAAAALVALTALAAADERELAYTLGVGPADTVSNIWPGEEVCQRPLTAEDDFGAVRLQVSARQRAELAVTAVPLDDGRPLASARGSFPGGRSDLTLDFDETVSQDTRFALCIRNVGSGVFAVYGGRSNARDGTAVYENGSLEQSDLTLVFLRDQPRSALSLVPEMFERAALFRPGFIGAWTFWVLLVLVAVGVPALMAAALRSAIES